MHVYAASQHPALTLLWDFADQAVQTGGPGLSWAAFIAGALRQLSVALCRLRLSAVACWTTALADLCGCVWNLSRAGLSLVARVCSCLASPLVCFPLGLASVSSPFSPHAVGRVPHQGPASLCRSGAYVATQATGRTPMRGLSRPSTEVVWACLAQTPLCVGLGFLVRLRFA
jgi:hypothetical protein